MKRRVFEIAKELGLTSKDVIQMLASRGIQVKSHMSAVEDPVARELLNQSTPTKKVIPQSQAGGSPPIPRGRSLHDSKTDLVPENVAPQAPPKPAVDPPALPAEVKEARPAKAHEKDRTSKGSRTWPARARPSRRFYPWEKENRMKRVRPSPS